MENHKIDIAFKKKSLTDIHSTSSDLPGLRGYLEGFLRRFRTLSFLLLLLPLVILVCVAIGISATPGLMLFDLTRTMSAGWPWVLQQLALGFALAFGYLLYGLTLIFVVPLFNFLLPFRVRPFRGIWFSLKTVPWYFHNGLTYLVRFTFLEFITPSPLNVLFFRMMGMKIGKGVVINTSHISDPCLITIDDYVTIGGSATIFAHYGQKGFLILAPVHIGKGATIGLKASIMGGVVVEPNTLVKPHTALLPQSRVKPESAID